MVERILEENEHYETGERRWLLVLRHFFFLTNAGRFFVG